ncbi:hypothetical protein R1flu_010318 [Riccia fluitans]|uniref:Uncharacterized protein n=1 Tax=Riccia fluitans TaxID=41844 RepID=A0ABD1Z4M9_9MARC
MYQGNLLPLGSNTNIFNKSLPAFIDDTLGPTPANIAKWKILIELWRHFWLNRNRLVFEGQKSNTTSPMEAELAAGELRRTDLPNPTPPADLRPCINSNFKGCSTSGPSASDSPLGTELHAEDSRPIHSDNLAATPITNDHETGGDAMVTRSITFDNALPVTIPSH